MNKTEYKKGINFCERNQKIKQNLLKGYAITLLLGVIFIVAKGFI